MSYHELLNGQPSRCFKPERALRQGDPLSPYISVLRADVFSGLLKEDAHRKEVHGITVAGNAPCISHLFFADDSLLFARANSAEAKNIMDVFKKHQDVLG